MKKWSHALTIFFESYFVLFFPYITTLAASFFNTIDSDLGWHIKYGEYFFRTGHILRNNIFSSTMEGFQWINHSWGTDLLTYAVFSRLGFLGLSILSAVTITLSLYFIAKTSRLSFWGKAIVFPLILFFNEPLFIVGFRSQLISILCITILCWIISKWKSGNNKILLWTLPLFFIWSNVHGEFMVGFGLLGVWCFFQLAVYLFQRKIAPFSKTILPFSILGLAVFGVTLLNPFGIGIYTEAFHHFGNPLSKYIIEWIPLPTYSRLWWLLVSWSIAIFLSIGVIIKNKKFSEYFPSIGISVFFIILSFWMRRYAWIMYVISIPVLNQLVEAIKPANKKLANSAASIVLIAVYLYFTFVKNTNLSIPTMNWQRYCKDFVACSPQSAEFIIQNNLTDNLFSFYNWGGWIIANYPQIKPSMDGRMPFWVDGNGYSAFWEYYQYEQNWKNIDASDYDVVWMTPKKPIYQTLLTLTDEGKWKEVYKDEYASVFVRN